MKHTKLFMITLIVVLGFLMHQQSYFRYNDPVDAIIEPMKELQQSLLKLDVLCESFSREELLLIEDIADKLDSPRVHLSDTTELLSSGMGLLSGVLILSSLIPSPFSPALMYIGSLSAFASSTGYLTNEFVLKDSNINKQDIDHVLRKVTDYQLFLLEVRKIYNSLGMLNPNALLITNDIGYDLDLPRIDVNDDDIQHLLKTINNLKTMIKHMDGKRLSLQDIVHLSTSIDDWITKLREIFGDKVVDGKSQTNLAIVGEKFDLINENWKLKTAFERAVSGYHITSPILNNVVLKGVSGVFSFYTIVSEFGNIREIEMRMKDKKEMATTLRKVARDLDILCDGTLSCNNRKWLN